MKSLARIARFIRNAASFCFWLLFVYPRYLRAEQRREAE